MAVSAEQMERERAFAAMQAEWAAIATPYDQRVAEWEPSLQAMISEEAAKRRAGTWLEGPDDFFGVLGIGRREVAHSAMIAWLLSPCARHGLGTRLLGNLLEARFPELPVPGGLHEARASCEVQLGDGRLDILVEAPGLHLVIENKVDAAEGAGQCEYYFDRTVHPNRRFILLSPEGRRAEGREEVVSAFRPLSYSELASLLETALASALESRGRALAVDYLRTLRREFP